MSSVSKKCNNFEENNERDRLRELPDELLVHILSFMPTFDAVRTVLLRRFGNLWTMIPSLEFDDGDIWRLIGHRRRTIYDLIPYFTAYVCNVLGLHRSATIDKFDLSICELDWNYYDMWVDGDVLDVVKLWVDIAVDKEVKVLRLIYFRVGNVYVLPDSVFTSQFLVELRLENVGITRLGHVEMRSLKILWLTRFDMSNELFNKLISGCPSLKLLHIEDQFLLDELRFTAPSIEVLELHVQPCLLDCPNLKVLNISLFGIFSIPKVVDVSSLREVVIWSAYSAHEIIELVNVFCKVEVFKLWMDDLTMPLQLNHYNLPQTRWTHLHINPLPHNEEHILSICRMLSGSPHLEELELDESSRLRHEDCSELNVELPPPFAMPLLKTVTLRGYVVSCQGLLRVVEFLLKSAEVLEKIVVIPKKYELAAVDKDEFVKKLSGLVRASTTAKVVFG